MIIMIDTNIIISAILFPNGRAAKAFMKALMPPYQPIICDYILGEVYRKFLESGIDDPRILGVNAFLEMEKRALYCAYGSLAAAIVYTAALPAICDTRAASPL